MKGNEIYIYAVPRVLDNGYHDVIGNATVITKNCGITRICHISYDNVGLVKQDLMDNPDRDTIMVYNNWRPNGYELVWLGEFKSEWGAKEYIKKKLKG